MELSSPRDFDPVVQVVAAGDGKLVELFGRIVAGDDKLFELVGRIVAGDDKLVEIVGRVFAGRMCIIPAP